MRVGIYCRISRDATDEGLGVERQREDCQALAKRQGWEVVETYIDNDISASTSSRQPRPAYDAMHSAAEAGKFDVLVCYSADRLTRRMVELVPFVAWARSTGLRFVTVDGDDTASANGTMVLHIKGSVAQQEAERASERLRRRWQADAASGKPRPGRFRAYGYTKAFEPIDAEAEVVRDIFIRRAGGESATSIARLLNEEGHTAASGGPWTQSNLSKMLSRPGYGGLREYRGKIVGSTNYPSLVSEPLWRAANDQAAKTSTGTNARRWLLSGIAVCQRCGSPMMGSSTKGYRCRPAPRGCGSMRIRDDWLEDPVVSLVLAREVHHVPAQEPSTAPADLGAVDRDIEALRAAQISGDLDLDDFLALTKGLKAKRRALEARAVEQTRGQAPYGSIVTTLGWHELSLSEQRATIGRHLVGVEVGPRQSRGPGRYEPERLTMHWRDGTVQQVTQEALDQIPQRHSREGRWHYPEGTARIMLPGIELGGDGKVYRVSVDFGGS